jgi:hypothetical protein
MAWAPDYITVAQLADYCKVTGDEDDPELASAVTSASRAVDLETSRQFGLVAAVEPRYYTAHLDKRRWTWVIEIDDLMTTTGLLVAHDPNDDDTFVDSITEYILEPRNAAAKGRPWERIIVRRGASTRPCGRTDAVRVTARFGWTAVPDPIVEAVKLQGSRFFARRDSPYGVAGSPENSSELRLLAKVDPDVAVALRGYRRWWGAR